MPTYNIAGKTINTEEPLTEAQIEEIYEDLSGKVVGSDMPATPTEDTGIAEQKNFYLNALQQGLGDFVTSLVPDVFKYDYEAYKDVPVDNWGELARQQEQQFAASVQQAVGAEQLQPSGKLQGYVGQGIRTTAAEGPLAMMGATKNALSTLVTAPLTNVVSGIGGAAGQDVGRSTGEALDAPAPVTTALETVGGALGGMAATVPSQVTTGLASRGLETARQFRTSRQELTDAAKESSKNLDNAIENLATNEIQQVIKHAEILSEGTTVDAIKNHTALAEKMRGLDIPPFMTLVDNPIYRKNIEYLYTTNPEFRQKATEAYAANLEVITARLEQRYGSIQAAEKELAGMNQRTNAEALERSMNKRIQEIDNQIAKVTDKLTTQADTVDIGGRVNALIEAKKSAVRSKLSPEYEKVLTSAENRGIRMKSSAVEGIYNYVENTGNREKFAAMPSLYKKINTFWKPVVDPERPKTQPRSPDVSVREVDSLKREINAQLRKVKDPQKIDLLNGLKTQLNESIAAMPPTFSQRYRAVDNKYYEELGIPLNTEGVKQLDATRFNDQAGRLLVKPEQAADFLSMVGPKGVPIVQDAILLQFQNAAIKEGKLDVKAATKFLNKNKRVIDTVPELSTKMADVATSIRSLENLSARINADYANKAKQLTDGFYRAFNTGGLKKVTADIFNSPTQRAKHLEQLKNFDPETAQTARKGIQASMVEKAMSARGADGKPISTMEFLKKNENAFNDVFGPRYIKDLEVALEALDVVRNADLTDLSQRISFRDSDFLSEKVGVSFPQFQSVLRDRISNAGTKAAILVSKAGTSRLNEKRDSQLAEFMLNPKAIEEIAKVGVELKKPNLNRKQIEDQVFSITNILMNAVSRGIYFGVQEPPEEVEEGIAP